MMTSRIKKTMSVKHTVAGELGPMEREEELEWGLLPMC